jgi:hypothetical protein
MYDLLDLLGPRIYVVNEKHYNELLGKRRKERLALLEAEQVALEQKLEKLKTEISSLKE